MLEGVGSPKNIVVSASDILIISLQSVPKSRPLKASREEMFVVEKGGEIGRKMDINKGTVVTTTYLMTEELIEGTKEVEDHILLPRPKEGPSFSL